MKDTWKSLKSLICPKGEWINDEDQTICTCCNKPFRTLFRRRHHCRSCGRLFCSDCSNNYINGTYIDSSLEKYLRLCQFCNEKIESSLREINICLEQQLPEQEDGSESESSSTDSDEDRDIILPIFEQLIPSNSRNQRMLDDSIKSKLKVISHVVCGKYGLEIVWQQKLADYAFKAADETVIDSIFSKNTMDILKTVNITTICCSKCESTRVFRGYASENNVISKQMRSSFSKAKVIIIMGSLEISSFSSEKLKFQELITKQKPMLKKILYKLIKLNPDLIIVEGIVNYTAKEYLESKGIAVVCRVSKEVLDNIKKVTKIRKTIDKIHKVETYKPEQVVGTCKKAYFQKHQNSQLKDKTMMYLEDADSNVISIVLAHNNEDKLPNLRKAMEQILKIARQLTLQKQIIEIEESKLIKPNPHFKNTIVSFLDQQISIQKLLQMKECRFSRAKYIPLKLANFPDIESLGQIEHYRKNSPYNFKSILKKPWELCNIPTMLVKQFYSDDDISLGGFFLLEVANMNINCESCGNQKYTHVNLFHYSNKYIKVWLEKSIEKPNPSDNDEENKPVNMYVSKELLHIHLKQKFKDQIITSKQKVITFLECAECSGRLSDEIVLSKKYLENSFQYFLLKLFLSQEIKYDEAEEDPVCSHREINRVIQSEDVSLKFQTGKLTIYSVSEIDFTLQQTKSYLLQQDLSHINQLVLNELPKIAEYVASIMAELENLRNPSLQGLTKRGLKYRESEIKLMETCSSLLLHIKQTKQVYSSSIEILVNDYTIIRKQIDQIIIYLDLIYKVYLKIEHFHRKDKKDDDELESQETNIQGSLAKLNISIIENGNSKLQHLKPYLDTHKRIQWVSKDQMNIFEYTPVFRDNPLSLVAHALNSKDYQKIKDSNNQVVLKVETTEKHHEIENISNLINPIFEQLKIDSRTNKHDHSVKIMFPRQFQEIRVSYGLDFNLYLKSLIDCHDLYPSGGKSDAQFKRSYNNLFIVKEIKDKQFLEFSEFFLKYHEHMKSKSYISKIFGMYEVDNSKCLIVMENLSFNFDSKSIVCYDLKGSDFKRFAHHKESNRQFTGKDTNFRLDRNGEPLYLNEKEYDTIESVLEKDCGFLLKQEVIDYSLLLFVDVEKNSIRMGIIDFMRPFNLIERVENIYKKIVKGNNPTVVGPKHYQSRFFGAMKKYFLRSQGCVR